jgi:hypothetical protein
MTPPEMSVIDINKKIDFLLENLDYYDKRLFIANPEYTRCIISAEVGWHKVKVNCSGYIQLCELYLNKPIHIKEYKEYFSKMEKNEDSYKLLQNYSEYSLNIIEEAHIKHNNYLIKKLLKKSILTCCCCSHNKKIRLCIIQKNKHDAYYYTTKCNMTNIKIMHYDDMLNSICLDDTFPKYIMESIDINGAIKEYSNKKQKI